MPIGTIVTSGSLVSPGGQQGTLYFWIYIATGSSAAGVYIDDVVVDYQFAQP